MIKYKRFFSLTTFAVGLAMLVVILGAYTRLTDAGLGCPDWPGCYGHFVVQDMDASNFYAVKAWTEMIHRYAAGLLVLTIFMIVLFAIKYYQHYEAPKLVPFLLLVIVTAQALLGMWTVTWQLLPQVVSLHLIGGFSTLALLWYLRLQIKDAYSFVIDTFAVRARPYVFFGLILLLIQIFLGAWVSSNYAALSCGTSFPKCQGMWHLPSGLSQIFIFSQSVGNDYTGGLLNLSQRMDIHMAHRFWALVTGTYIFLLSILFIFKSIQLRRIGLTLLFLLLLQILLGIGNVVLMLPLAIAVLHNAVAAMLLLAMITLAYASAHSRSRLNV